MILISIIVVLKKKLSTTNSVPPNKQSQLGFE
jgi:hypothetical protein